MNKDLDMTPKKRFNVYLDSDLVYRLRELIGDQQLSETLNTSLKSMIYIIEKMSYEALQIRLKKILSGDIDNDIEKL